MLFVPVFFVCWINGFCLEGWKKETNFKTEEECKLYIAEWKDELLPQLYSYGKGMPFRVITNCAPFKDGVVPERKMSTRQMKQGKDI